MTIEQNSYINTIQDKTSIEWLILALNVAIAGFLTFVAFQTLIKDDIYDRIIGIMILLLVLVFLFITYRFFVDDPWGWFGSNLAQIMFFLILVFASLNDQILGIMADIYSKIFRAFSEVAIGFFEEGLDSFITQFGNWWEQAVVADDSFFNSHGIILGIFLTLLGLYWSLGYVNGTSSAQDTKKRTYYILGIILLLISLGLNSLFANPNFWFIDHLPPSLIGAIIGSFGVIFDLILVEIKEREIITNFNPYFILVLKSILILSIALLSQDILISIAIIISAVASVCLQHPLIRDKFDSRWTAEEREERTAYVMLLPTVSIILIIVLIPVIWIFWSSFFQVGLRNLGPNAVPPEFVGLKNYWKFLRDDAFYVAIFTSLLYTLLTVIFSTLFGLIAALLLNREFYGRGVTRGVMLFPYIASTIAMIFLWMWAVDGIYGIFNYLLFSLGLIPVFKPWIDMTPWAFIICVFFEVWKYFPFAMLMILARLQAIPSDLYEAADIDGANAWQQFSHITIPELRYVIGVVVLLRTIWTFNKFDDVYLFTMGSEETGTLVVPIYIFDKVWTGGLFRVSEAAAIATVVVIVLLIFSITFGKKVLKW